MPLSLFSYAVIILHSSLSPPHFPSSTLPPCLSSQPWLTSPGADLCLVGDSLLLLICPFSGTVVTHQERKGWELTLSQGCLLQLSAAALLVGSSLVVIPEVTMLVIKFQQLDHVEDL